MALAKGNSIQKRSTVVERKGGRYNDGARTQRPPLSPQPPQPDPCLTTGSYFEGRWLPVNVEARTTAQPIVVGYREHVIDLTAFGGYREVMLIPEVALVEIAVFIITYRWQYARFSCNGQQLTEWTDTEYTTCETAMFVDDTRARAAALDVQVQNQVDAFQRQLTDTFNRSLTETMTNASAISTSAVNRAAVQTATNILSDTQTTIAAQAQVEIPNSDIGKQPQYIDVNFANDASDLDERTFTIRGAGKAHTFTVGQTMTGRAIIESGIIPDTNSEPINPSSEYVITHVGLDTTRPRPGVIGMGGTSYPGRITIHQK